MEVTASVFRRFQDFGTKFTDGGGTMRFSHVALMLVLVSGVPAQAQDSSQTSALAAAQELTAIVSGQVINDLLASMSGPIWTNLANSLQGKVDDAAIAELHVEFDRIVKKYLDQSMTQMPTIYARHFSAGELRELIAIYKTPLGQKMLREMPKVMGDFTQTVYVPLMAPMQAELRSSIADIIQRHQPQK